MNISSVISNNLLVKQYKYRYTTSTSKRLTRIKRRYYGILKQQSMTTLKQPKLPPPQSFSSDILLYDLSYIDIFTISALKNLFLFQIPSIFLYRMMSLTVQQIAYFLLFNAVLKCVLDMIVIGV